MTIAQLALKMVPEGSVVGLGTGHAASDFVRLLGQQVRQGFDVRCVATSRATQALARELGIPLIGLGDVESIDLTFDGADAVDPELDLIKGLGGALLREKIVAASSDRLIILVGDEKLTNKLGQGYCRVLPTEIVPFALPLVRRELAKRQWTASLRADGGQPAPTDNGNYILDIDLDGFPIDPKQVQNLLKPIPGVIETGLFLGMADTVLIQHENGRVETRERSRLG